MKGILFCLVGCLAIVANARYHNLEQLRALLKKRTKWNEKRTTSDIGQGPLYSSTGQGSSYAGISSHGSGSSPYDTLPTGSKNHDCTYNPNYTGNPCSKTASGSGPISSSGGSKMNNVNVINTNGDQVPGILPSSVSGGGYSYQPLLPQGGGYSYQPLLPQGKGFGREDKQLQGKGFGRKHKQLQGKGFGREDEQLQKLKQTLLEILMEGDDTSMLYNDLFDLYQEIALLFQKIPPYSGSGTRTSDSDYTGDHYSGSGTRTSDSGYTGDPYSGFHSRSADSGYTGNPYSGSHSRSADSGYTGNTHW